jgi:hypothetical protein
MGFFCGNLKTDVVFLKSKVEVIKSKVEFINCEAVYFSL